MAYSRLLSLQLVSEQLMAAVAPAGVVALVGVNGVLAAIVGVRARIH